MNNNTMEYDYLNGTQKPPKQKKNIFLKIIDIFILLFSICCNIFILCLEAICKLIELICWGDVAYSAYKTIKNKKRKRWF